MSCYYTYIGFTYDQLSNSVCAKPRALSIAVTIRATNLDKGEDVRDDVVLAARGEEHEAHAGGLAGVPVVLVVELFLFRHGLHEERHDELEGALRVEPADVLWWPALLLHRTSEDHPQCSKTQLNYITDRDRSKINDMEWKMEQSKLYEQHACAS